MLQCELNNSKETCENFDCTREHKCYYHNDNKKCFKDCPFYKECEICVHSIEDDIKETLP